MGKEMNLTGWFTRQIVLAATAYRLIGWCEDKYDTGKSFLVQVQAARLL
jgi:hypothetical protein